MKYLAFEIEIAKEIPEGETDWKAHRPLGITCAAAASSDGGLWNWWAHDGNGIFADRMSEFQCVQLVEILHRMTTKRAYTLLTWDGLDFNFDILAEESGMHNECKELALGHIDMMFHFYSSKGFPLGLDAAAKGMGLQGKPEGMTGALAPELWAKGEYHRVLDYVSWDAKNTLALAEAVENAYCLEWTAKSGRQNTWYLGCSEKWLTVKEAMALPEPDTSNISQIPQYPMDAWQVAAHLYGKTAVDADHSLASKAAEEMRRAGWTFLRYDDICGEEIYEPPIIIKKGE